MTDEMKGDKFQHDVKLAAVLDRNDRCRCRTCRMAHGFRLPPNSPVIPEGSGREWRIHWNWEDGRETNCEPEPEALVDDSLERFKMILEDGGPDIIVCNPRKQWRTKATPAGPWQDAPENPNAQ